jgi:electron transfer flavoprotein-quinone oxidoreductase
VLSLFTGAISGLNGRKGVYYTEIYTNRDSVSMTAEVPLDVLQACGVPSYDVLAARERHPHIARLIQGATPREYQAHLIPWGGVADPDCLYGYGVLLTGDAGKFMTTEGVGSWPAMASGAAAARTVLHACEKGDFSRATLAIYLDLLDEEGMIETQREAREGWEAEKRQREIAAERPEHLIHIARRYFADWMPEEATEEYAHSLWGEVYHNLIKPLTPWYLRWPLGLAAWLDTLGWRRRSRQASRHGTKEP